jgi:ATP-dependent Clp protease protease subunit
MSIKYFYLFYLFALAFNQIYSQQIITLKKNNFVSFNDTINIENVELWSKQMNKLTSNPFYIYINSPGGSVDAGLQFINNINWYIKQGKTVNCIVKSAYSMAFIILQNCSNRYVMSSSTLMQHQMSLGGLKGPLNNLMNYLEMIQSISNELDIIVSNRLGLSLEDYRNKIKTDWWLTGNSAIIQGVADEIVIVGCDPELYDIQSVKEDLILDINSKGNLGIKKIEKTTYLCPL